MNSVHPLLVLGLAARASAASFLTSVAAPVVRPHGHAPARRSHRCRMHLDVAPNMMRDLEAAFLASAIATVCLHPLDTLAQRCRKTHEQQDMDAGVSTEVQHEQAPTFASLYTGCGANILKEAPDAAVFLALSEQLRAALAINPWFASHLTFTLLLCGAIGDACGSILRLPAEVVLRRLQMGTATDWTDALADTPLDSWKASWAAILYRDVPMGGLQIATYQEARLHAPAIAATLSGVAVTDGIPDSISDVLAGLLAGAVAAALTTPFDVLVTHTTTQPSPSDGSSQPSALQVGARLIAEEGPLTLTRGIGWRSLYYAYTVGAFFGLYEYFRRALDGM